MDRGLPCDLKETAWSAEVPPAAVYMRPQQEGSVIRGKVWESPMLVSLQKLTVPPETLATGAYLFLMVRASLCVCGWGSGRGCVDSKH